MFLLPHLDRLLSTLFAWSVGSIGTTVVARPAGQIAALTGQVLEPILDAPRGPGASSHSRSSAASSTDIVPYENEVSNPVQAAYVLGLLNERGAQNARVRFDSLANVNANTISELVKFGVLTLGVSEFGEQTVAIRPEAVTDVPAYGVRSPIPAYRVITSLPSKKHPKGLLLFRLHELGWLPEAGSTEYTPDAAMLYKPGFSQPLSYFRSLYEASLIFGKGVPKIMYGKSDYYYKCLLDVDGPKLMPLLDGLEEQADEWLRNRYRALVPVKNKGDDGDGSSDGSGGDGGDAGGGAIVPVGGLGGILEPVVADRIPWWQTEWQRCWVTLNGQSCKVWFDNCCGANGIRRGWANCGTHRCGKLKPVVEDRDYFACALALWRNHGFGNDAMSRAEHMAFWPTDADIRAAIFHCRFGFF